jgi:Na+/H+-dicarboxylate symporter
MSGWVARVHDERVEVVGEAAGGGGEATLVQVVDERLEAMFGVLFADRVIQGFPIGVLDAFAFSFGELGVEVPRAVDAAALAV